MNEESVERPPIDVPSVHARLERARSGGLFVSVRRWIPDADRIDGYVISLGPHWVVLAVFDNFTSIGWCLLRCKDVQSVFIEPDSVVTRVLTARNAWPPPAVELRLDDAAAALRSASDLAPLISIHVEFDRPDICWVGAATSIKAGTLHLLEVDTQGQWMRGPRAVDLEDVTRIEFGGPYEQGLASIAGPLPES